MRKLGLGISVMMGLLVVGLAPAVYADSAKTMITGKIAENGSPVEGADVEVECAGTLQMDTTDASGVYLVGFTADECPVGTQALIKAKKGSMSGSGTTDVQARTTKLNVGVMNLAIPEFGWLGGLLATGAGIGAIAFTRRRYAGQASCL